MKFPSYKDERTGQPIVSNIYANNTLLIGLLLFIATALFLYKIDDFPLSTDELYSVYDARELKLLYYRPLYYILLNIWMRFSVDEGWLRSLAVLFGLGSIVLTYQLGRRLAGNTVGLISAILMTLSPLMIGAAHQVRMYTLGNFLTLAGSLALIDVLRSPTTASMAFWAASRFLALLTIPLSVTILLPDAILIFASFRKQYRKLLKIAIWLVGIIILWIPFAILLLTAKSYYEGTWGVDLAPPSMMHIVRHLKFFTFWPGRAPSNQLIANFHRVFTAALAFPLGIALFSKYRDSKLIWIIIWLFLPLLVLVLLSNVSSLEFLTRYVMFTAPFLFMLLAVGFIRILKFQRILGMTLAVAYCIAVGGGILNYYSNLNRVPNWLGANLEISRNEQVNDAIAVSIPHARVCPFITHYYQGNAPVYGLSPLHGKVNEQQLDDFVRSLPQNQPRIWLLFRKAFKGSFKDLEIALDKKYSILRQDYFHGGIKVLLLEPRLPVSQAQVDRSSQQFKASLINCVRDPQIVFFQSLDEGS